uniref:Dual adapter for phosphotyrosine and 3-phosphotyrosine and 3-phosphoinositide n=1 Tax=Eptatretus burgeri TaxID=7764 RepID=A0A8C4NCJ5_EPTBU
MKDHLLNMHGVRMKRSTGSGGEIIMQEEEIPPQPRARSFTNWFHSIFQDLSWYHEEVNHHLAECLLRQSDDPGTYLLRRRTSINDGFVISVRLSDSVGHFSVSVTSGKTIQFGTNQFTSVEDFIRHFDNEIVLATPAGLVSLKRKCHKNLTSPEVYEKVVAESRFPNSAQDGNEIPTWKRRYCKLDRAEFKYFKDLKETKARKCLDLKTCIGVIWDPSQFAKSPRGFNGGRIFCLVFKERTYYMYGDTECASEKWKQILEKVVVFQQEHQKKKHWRINEG